MDVLLVIMSFGMLVFDVISKEGNLSNSNSNTFLDTYELTHDEKLLSMNVDKLDYCYATSKTSSFSLTSSEQLLSSSLIKGFEVKDIVAQGSCINIRIKHSIPYNSGINDFGTSFSINCIIPTKNIIVYGFTTFNKDERKAFFDIADEIINVLSR